MSDKVFVGSKIEGLDIFDVPPKVSRVTLIVDNDTQYTTGDDTGKTIEKTVPWASQEMADAILAKIKDYSYRPFSATNAIINPAAEIGDGVTVNGLYSVIAQLDTDFSGMSTSQVTAPGTDEIEDEYPYKTQAERQAQREQARLYSKISKSTNEILLEVGEISGAVTSLSVTLDGVTIAGDDGSTLINGAAIKTGTISADKLNISGAISFGDLDTETQSKITDAEDAAEEANDVIKAWGIAEIDLNGDLKTYIDGGMISTNSIYTDSIHLGGELMVYKTKTGSAPGGYLGYVEGATNPENITKGIGLMNSSDTGQVIATSGGAKISHGESPSIYVSSWHCVMENGGEHLVWNSGANLYCDTSSSAYLGTSTHKWAGIWVATDPTLSSDRARKNNISYDYSKFEQLFDELKPATYRLNIDEGKENDGHFYTGFIANDIEDSLQKIGMDNSEFSALVITKDEGGNKDRSLRYSEFIPLCVHEIQKLKSQVAELRAKL